MKKIVALLILVVFLLPCMVCAQSPQLVERQYKWFAEEKLTVSSTVITLSSEEYNYEYGPTRINVLYLDANDHYVLDEVVTDGTTAAMGIVKGFDDSNAPTYLDIQILYNGLDSADIDPNDTLTGATNTAQAYYTNNTKAYTRGVSDGFPGQTMQVNPQIAEIHVLDNSCIYTLNSSTPTYSATDSLCVGRKIWEGDTIYIFGADAIVNFKAIRNSTSDCIIYCKYGY